MGPQESRWWWWWSSAFALVGAEVFDSGRTVSKAFATLRAEVGFLPCVHTMVFHQIRASSETFATLRTLVCEGLRGVSEGLVPRGGGGGLGMSGTTG